MSPSRILVVRLGAMGDIIGTLPAVHSLRQSFPQSYLAWAVEEKWVSLLAGSNLVDEILAVNRRSVRATLRLASRLRAGHFDTAIDFQGLVKSAIVATLAHPLQIAGWHRSAAREPLASLLYSNTVKPQSAHVVEQNLELAAATGATSRACVFPLPAGHAEGTLPEGEFVLANPLAGWASKQWPLEYHAELGEKLERAGFALVLNGSDPVEAPHTTAHVSSLSGLIDATRRAVAVVGVDSGPLHLAAALGKRGVAIFGPTDPSRNGPYGGTIEVLRAAGAETSYKRKTVIAPSMRAISPTEVWEALEKQLRATGRKRQ